MAVAESAMGGFRKKKIETFSLFIKLFLQEILISYKIFKKMFLVLDSRMRACARVCRRGEPSAAAIRPQRFGVPEPPSPSVSFNSSHHHLPSGAPSSAASVSVLAVRDALAGHHRQSLRYP